VVGGERFRRLYLMMVSSVVELDAKYQRCLPHGLGRHHLLCMWSFFAGGAYLGLRPQMSGPAAMAILWAPAA
jgi:hypothetical protein